ncbi:MAG TPA: hypothetical protein VGQ59_14170 [Cyclobacteriaceae bacterium]|jgi:hypothetical protein|nr:hypothetical protein [Cyclobacteriaceae bacterium]
MIEIQIADRKALKAEYISVIKPIVLFDIECLKYSIGHLTGVPYKYNKKYFPTSKGMTAHLIKTITGQSAKQNGVKKDKYSATIGTFRAWVHGNKRKNLPVDLVKINSLFNFLISKKGAALEELLTCAPQKLTQLEDALLPPKFRTEENIEIIKLVFDFEKRPKTSSAIKRFFRLKNIVKFCPYCNLNQVEYLQDSVGGTAAVHELDHFFHKAKHRLLSYSLFNLVPSDSTCNGPTHKGTNEFSDKFHLNPYNGGFENDFAFRCTKNAKGKVDRIKLQIKAPLHTRRRWQLNGNLPAIEDGHERGNFNIFKIESRFNSQTQYSRLDRILKAINTRAKASRFNSYWNKKMKLKAKEVYLDWYDETMEGPFQKSKFNEYAMAKLQRDIHDDFFLNQDKSPNNLFVRNLIRNS